MPLLVSTGVPLTQIANGVATSVRMIEQHYAGVIASWDRKPIVAETQIHRARPRSGRKMDATRLSKPSPAPTNAPQIR